MALGLPDFARPKERFNCLHKWLAAPGVGRLRARLSCRLIFRITTRCSSRRGHDFAGFYDKELQFRAWMHYPPYSAIANVLIRSEKLDEALAWSGELGPLVREDAA